MNGPMPTPAQNREYVLQQGVKLAADVQIHGPIQVVRHPEAVISLGEGVVLNGHVAYNAIILANRTSLAALDPGAVIQIGKGSGLSSVTIAAAKWVSIGENTYVGADVMITDTDFHTPLEGGGWSDDHLGSCGAIWIGDNCFIGARAVILKGVTIGDGAIVAANALVTRDVPPYHLAIGNPATVKPLSGKWLVNAPRDGVVKPEVVVEKTVAQYEKDVFDLQNQVQGYQKLLRSGVSLAVEDEPLAETAAEMPGIEVQMLQFYEKQMQLFRDGTTPWFLKPRAWLVRWNRNWLRKKLS